jgi:uncharacterized membrane protein YidH (DUF202 family)
MHTLFPTKRLKTSITAGIFFLLTTFPYIAHAEAFKGGFLSSSTEKALFFITIGLFIILIIGGFFILKGTWEWLQTGKTDQLKIYLPKIGIAILSVLVLSLFAFFM